MGMRLPVAERQQQSLTNTPRQSQNLSRQMPMQDTDYIDRADSFLAEMEKRRREAEKRARDLLLRKSQNAIDAARQMATQNVLKARGENSFKAADDSSIKLRDDTDAIISQLPEAVRSDAEIYAGKSFLQYNKTSTGHTLAESRRVQDETYKTRNMFLTESAAANAYDRATFESTLVEIDTNTEAYERYAKGGMDGNLSPEVALDIAAKKLDAKSTAITKTVEVLASQGDIKTAEFYATEYRNQLTPTDIIKINGILNRGREDNVEDQALVIMSKVLEASQYDQIAANALVRDLSGGNGKLYAKSKTFVDAAIKDYNEDVQKTKDENLAKEMENIRTGRSYNFKNVAVEDREKLRDYLEKKNADQLNVRNPQVYNNLYTRMIEQPEIFYNTSRTNIRSMANGLSGSDIQFFEAEQRKGLDPQTKKFRMSSVNDIVNRVLDSEVRSRLSPTDDREKYYSNTAAIKQIGMEVMEDVKASLGDRASEAEVRERFEKEFVTRAGTKETKILDSRLTRIKKFFTGEPLNQETKSVPVDNPSLGNYNREGSQLETLYGSQDIERARAILFEAQGGVNPTRTQIFRMLEAEKNLIRNRQR